LRTFLDILPSDMEVEAKRHASIFGVAFRTCAATPSEDETQLTLAGFVAFGLQRFLCLDLAFSCADGSYREPHFVDMDGHTLVHVRAGRFFFLMVV